MIRKAADTPKSVAKEFKGGKGELASTEILLADEMGGHGRKFAITTLNPGCSIGYHVHSGDSETYYILSGKAKYSDNGVEAELSAGDMTHCPDGEGHGIEAIGTESLVFVALILYTGYKG